MKKKKIWAIILAGGESKRMGQPKMLLPFMGKTMLDKVIENVTGSLVTSTLVVLGKENEKITRIVEDTQVKYCFNNNYKEGMLSSVICGIRNLPAETDAVLVFQGDQPLIPPAVADRVIEAYLSSDKGIVMPLFLEKRGHPLLIDMKYRSEIEKLDPAKGLRSLPEKYPDDILEVETDEPGILKDFDTFEEYTREINQIS
jgi:CTP:molybdopterin cytidylyltransferase MocA